MPAPFVQLAYDALPERPRVPHPWRELPVRQVRVYTEALGGVTLPVRELGHGPPLLLVHGLMTTGYSWRYVVEPLARRHRVIVPDLPGAGDAETPRGRLRPEAVADALYALQQALRIRGCDVVGNSMGGYLGLWLTLRHRDAARRLIVLHAPAVAGPRMWALWGAMRLPGAPAVLGALVRRDPRRWAHRNVHYWDESLKSVEEASVYGDVLATPEGLRGFVGQLRDTMNAPDLARLGRVLRARRRRGLGAPVPTTLIYAPRDPMVPAWHGRALARWIGDAELRWLDRGSHFAHVDAPDAFLAAVDAAWPEV